MISFPAELYIGQAAVQMLIKKINNPQKRLISKAIYLPMA